MKKPGCETVLKDLVLIGGGHSHVAVIKSFGMKPLRGVRLTVIARDVHTPYSGMLPGYVAGHYEYDEAHIDLRPLCQFASARLFHDSATRIDTDRKQVICESRPPVTYDILSINIGSRPEITSVPGAGEFATPVKPINRFVDRWHELLQRVLEHSGPHRITVVGGGAAGVELILSIQFRLQQILREKNRQSEQLELTLISKSDRILPDFPNGVSKRFQRILGQRGIHVYTATEATRVTKTSLELSNGNTLDADEILWVTGASAPGWLRDSGLEVDDSGFILANDMLQSTNHADILAAGDIVHVINHPRPKAGVFAVRQGKPLTANLRRALLKQPLNPFAPQKTLLALISTGNQYAIASKAGLYLQGAKLWVWKDWIDRRFMQKFCDLPDMREEKASDIKRGLADQHTLKEISTIAMRCGGCGAKVGATTLSRAISEFQPAPRDDILIGLHEPDDAAVVEVPTGKVMLHTVDYFRAFIDDPYLFGQIAAHHCLSDIFAMGAEAQSALAIATVPYGIEAKVEDTIRQLMAGASLALNESNTALVGGHTGEGAELALGFSVNGLADREHILRKRGMQPGDVLILTKALGTGTLFAADMQYKARGRWIDAALESMIQSNRISAEVLYRHNATACTDITGFGLLGHMLEMARPSGVNVEINLQALPLLDGALEAIEMGILSSLQPANLRLRHVIANLAEVLHSPLYPLIFDPQTSGGLLASIPAQHADACLAELSRKGYAKATVIGLVEAQGAAPGPVRLVG